MTNDNEQKQAEAQTQAEPMEQEQMETQEELPSSSGSASDSGSEETESHEAESSEGEVAEEAGEQPQEKQPVAGAEELQSESVSDEETVSSEPSGFDEKPSEGEMEESPAEVSEEPATEVVAQSDVAGAAEEAEPPEADEAGEGMTSESPETDEEADETLKEEEKLKEIPEDPDKKWYVIHAHSGHENKVRQSLENRVRQEHLEEFVGRILIPSEEVAEVKGGKKRISSRKIFPGYVLIQMKLTHETWYLIRTTPGVTGFIGSGKTPTPLDHEEVQSIFDQMRGERKKPKPKMTFEKDEKVKIIEGPFTNFMGYVDEVNPERGKLKVMVEIFERLTSVELEFWQVEKI